MRRASTSGISVETAGFACCSVGEFTQRLSGLVRSHPGLQSVWIRGEVGSLTRPSSGHIYFTLRDSEAMLSCVLWRRTAASITFPLDVGHQVLVHGNLDVYAPRGQYQLTVDAVRPDGAGALQAQLERTRQKLELEGLFSQERKRPLPTIPIRIAVVTSHTGAVIRDIGVTLSRARPPVELILAPALVQGMDAAPSLVAALHRVAEHSHADLAILARGGGSIEDLWCFNLEEVVRAVAALPMPVISAVGHETDFTLTDLAADLRAATPTAAAEWIVQRRREAVERLAAARRRIAADSRYSIQATRYRFEALLSRASLSRPVDGVNDRRRRLDEICLGCEGRVRRRLEGERARLQAAAARLQGLSPLGVLSRGYAAVTRPDGESVTSVQGLDRDDQLCLRFLDGSAHCEVREIQILGVSI